MLQDDELDISPVEIDEGLVIEDDEISDDDDDENDDVCWFIVPFTELYRLNLLPGEISCFRWTCYPGH